MLKFIFWNLLLLIGTFIITSFWLFDSAISAIFSFILIYILVSICFFFLNIEFLGLLLLMVYVGGIVILFVFVTITLGGRISSTESLHNSTFVRVLLSLFGVKIYFFCDFLELWVIDLSFKTVFQETTIVHDYLYKYSDIYIFSNLLYNEFFTIVVLLGLILLWALIGSIILAKSN